MLLSVARHRRFYENFCIFFSWIIGFSHFYMCFCISFFLFFFFNTIANLREKILDQYSMTVPQKLQRTSGFGKTRSVLGGTVELLPPSSVLTYMSAMQMGDV